MKTFDDVLFIIICAYISVYVALSLLCEREKYIKINGIETYINSFEPYKLSKFDTLSLFDEAVECIKKHEGFHTNHYPYVGYGHKVKKGEYFTSKISEFIADSLLRCDLLEKCAHFRQFDKDSLLLGVLAYNVGENRLLGLGSIPKSKLIEKLEKGNRNIYQEYILFRKYKEVIVPSLENRRRYEFNLLFIKN